MHSEILGFGLNQELSFYWHLDAKTFMPINTCCSIAQEILLFFKTFIVSWAVKGREENGDQNGMPLAVYCGEAGRTTFGATHY